jgi:hypothetical protein
MKLLGDVGHVENHFGPFQDDVNVGARIVHGLRKMYLELWNHLGHTRWNS